ncbi:MAG: preprotein translocase subunit SecA [Candidatus Wildermuthbacteria bacterium]|nr:preprotein translocase subunit SecA [Candidatus Wildermuthbacteria bacterium]
MNIFQKIFKGGAHSLGATPLVQTINSLEPGLLGLSFDELKGRASALRKSIGEGKSLDDALVEAFSLVREVAKRTLNQRHFDVQLLGGIALHQGKIAEMHTGEGKTLTATLPAFLNALAQKGVHVVTVNDYLAKRDAVWMGQIYHALGLSIGCITHDSSYIYDPQYKSQEQDALRDEKGGFLVIENFLRPSARKEAYEADITYGTNNEFGFDYLRDNMAYASSMQVQRGNAFAIVDEVDSILIDEARTPLIISAPDQESSSWYRDFSSIIPKLEKGADYEIDEKLRAASLTDQGITKVEGILGVKDIYQEKGLKYLHHLEQALKAEVLFHKDKDYVVKNGEVVIVDDFTGRMLPGRRYSGGLHQALEAKEGVFVQPESITLGSITFQNYFRMYKKLAGMTGTAATSAEEFYKVYKLDVAKIPTNKPLVRKDLPDKIYKTEKAKFQALVKEVKERNEKGQPVLIGTVSIQKNEHISSLLGREGIPHKVLNAKFHEQEGQIIAQAGKKGAVTVATNMAGRGVDIILGGNPPSAEEAEFVKSVGGLHIIGTERHEARRIDNQLRGRAGRQGDPGSSQFFISLEDDIARIFGGERIKGLMEKLNIPEDEAIESKLVSGAIESAQARIEGFNFDARKHVLEYDDVLNKHRELIYRKRREVLEKFEQGTLSEHMQDLLRRTGHSQEEYGKKMQEIGEQNMKEAEKAIFLRAIDSVWIEHLENMEYLRDSVRLRAYGQQDPLVEYKNEGHKMFQSLLQNIDSQVSQYLMNVKLASAQHAHQHQHQQSQPKPSVGRNDPCPCGSGKKYKKCHGR